MMPTDVGLLAIAAMVGLIVLRCPIGLAMGLVGFTGFAVIVGLRPALAVLESAPYKVASTYGYTMIPLFILMGSFATRARLSDDLFAAARRVLGHWPGGLAVAAMTASAAFSTICGSSLATAATMTRISLPAMRAHGYDDRLSAASLAAGGTLGIMIPPSIALLLYALITGQSVATMFLAGLLPGLLAYGLYALTIVLVVRWRPALGGVHPGEAAAGSPVPGPDRVAAGVAPVAGTFVLVMGGMYGGVFTPTEAAGVGASMTLVIALWRGVRWRGLVEAVRETIAITITIFMILVGAEIFGFLLSVSKLSFLLAETVRSLGLGPTGVILAIVAAYVVLGCFMDSLAMMLLTVPILHPVLVAYAIDPVWFGIICVVAVELGLITPPVGLNLFVVHGAAPDLPLARIMSGILPFVLTDLVRILLIILFPGIALLLPRLSGLE